MRESILQQLLSGTASPWQYLGLAVLGAVIVGGLVWHVDEAKRTSKARR